MASRSNKKDICTGGDATHIETFAEKRDQGLLPAYSIQFHAERLIISSLEISFGDLPVKVTSTNDFVLAMKQNVPVIVTVCQKPASTGKTTLDNIQNTDEEPGLVSNRNEASRRLQVEEEGYVQRVLDQKKQQQDLVKKRKEERLAKESIRESIKGTFVEELSSFDDDKNDMEDEGLQAMRDIDNFERMVKISNERRKENDRCDKNYEAILTN